MTDAVSLDLVFDDETDAAVRAEWNALLAADLPSQARHRGESNRPHATLLVRSSLAPFDVADLCGFLPLSLTFGAPLLFGAGRHRVIARSVVPTAAVLALHARLHELAGPGADVDRTVPGAWTPHVTLARRVPLDRIGEALDALGHHGGGDLEARAVAIRRWDAATKTVTDLVGRGTLEQC
ncbi:hypothetical protein C1632_05290 [Microbacterium testaceum]|uniref:2'-5' RNA ligase family protein n=1 Tax=Microbacterium testaceum TaxID=2033 RepID=UPI000CCEA6C4|nr:2'-5' RNA ligase family protein [Microbacterium testaceum]PNW09814.1 hypothetical protein C1632_05290 [Microbacterium testaceum]